MIEPVLQKFKTRGQAPLRSFVRAVFFCWTTARVFPYHYAEVMNGRSLTIDVSPGDKPGVEPS